MLNNLNEIKEWCIKNKQKTRYRKHIYYLYNNRIYDENMNVFIDNAPNGFLDLFEYFEYFEQPNI